MIRRDQAARKNERGQMTIEMVLIMVILFGSTIAIAQYMRNQAVLASFIQGPWAYVDGMIKNGVWAPDNADSRKLHPNCKTRHGSVQGERI